MVDKKSKFHAVNEAAVTQFYKALEEAKEGQYSEHETPFLVDEAGHWNFPRANYIAGVDLYKEDGTGSIATWATVPIKPKDSDGN